MAHNNSSFCNDEMDFGFNFVYMTAPIACLIVLNNIFLIVTVCRTPSLHTKTNIYVTSMSVADILLANVYACFKNFEGYTNTFNSSQQRYITNFLFGYFNSAITVYVMHNAVIAFDRYIIIAHPFFYMKHDSKRWAYILLFFVWTLGLVFIFCPLFVYKDDKYHQRCILLHSPVTYYLTTTSFYAASSITILMSYSRIASLAFKHKMEANARRHHNSNYAGNTLSAALRSVKFFALMFGAFVFCTLPPVIVAGLNSFSTLPKLCIFIFILIPIYSPMRTIIYYKMNKNFSQAMAKTFSDLAALICKGT